MTQPLSLKTRLKNNETLVGLFINEFRSANYGLILNQFGYDFAIIDMEHCSFTHNNLSTMVPGLRFGQCQPLVRVPAVKREYFQSVLDLGVVGIVVPMVETADQVREAVDMIKYPPEGRRGLTFCAPHSRFEEVDRDRYTHHANDNIILVIQIETVRAVKNLKEILAVPGIDVVFIGNADLSLSMGQPNNLSKGPVREAVRTILQAAKEKNIPGGGNFVDPDCVGDFYQDGLRFITLGSEVEQLCKELRREMDFIHATLPESSRAMISPVHPLPVWSPDGTNLSPMEFNT